MNKTAGRGRRPGSPDTRERIREAARVRFLADGYQAVSLRAIAAEAGVDVALVSYYFGSKQGLFAATMALPMNPADIFQEVAQGRSRRRCPSGRCARCWPSGTPRRPVRRCARWR